MVHIDGDEPRKATRKSLDKVFKSRDNEMKAYTLLEFLQDNLVVKVGQ